MKSLKTNIKFNYEYRDAGNYKQFGSIVFANPSNILDLESLEKTIRYYLFDAEFFYPFKLSIPSLHFDNWNTELDHFWYRFESVEHSQVAPNDLKSRTVEQFISEISVFAKEY